MSNSCNSCGHTGDPGAPLTPEEYPFKDVPDYPTMIGKQPDGLPQHACMGLNSCKASDRFGLDGAPGLGPNDCAGQGFCSTSGYTKDYPELSDKEKKAQGTHTCHVQNNCVNQGGCGLYGTEREFDHPGINECNSMGSCATPINAERFFTTGPRQGTSVWLRAREVFKEKIYSELAKKNPDLNADQLPPVGGEEFVEKFGDVFKCGPAYRWLTKDNTERTNMTACGASGMSGAGGCG